LAHFDTAEWISQDWVEMGLRNVQARFRGWGKREGEVTSYQRLIWRSVRATMREGTSQTYRIQCW
jgi:hypothetical protein